MTTSLVRMAAGSVFPSHNHAGPEHSYVLEGDVRFEDHTLQPGDYEVALPSSAHTSITTTQGLSAADRQPRKQPAIAGSPRALK